MPIANHSNLIVSFCIILFSCSNSSDTKVSRVNAIRESIDYSTQNLKQETESLIRSLDKKKLDIRSTEEANIWYPKAKQLEYYSSSITAYIGLIAKELENGRSMSSKNIRDLFDHLISYKKNVLAVDPAINLEFSNSLNLTSQSYSESQGLAQFEDFFFSNSSTDESLLMLSKFENNIEVIKNRMIKFCDLRSHPIIDIWDWYVPMVNISSSIVRPGEEITVRAGIAAFSKAAMPEIMIAGIKIPVSESGEATYKFKSDQNLGKHSLPLSISYTDQDGKKNIIEKAIEYRVSHCQN
jgi:hypothetical protein